MQLKPHLLLIIAAIGIAIYFTQKNNDEPDKNFVDTAQKDQHSKVIANDNKSNSAEPTSTTSDSLSPQNILLASIEAINFPDKELKRCVLNEIKEGADSANIQNISSLTKLQCNAFKITSLDGIENLSSLEEVTIIGSDIYDATPLSKINSLRKIYLKGGNTNIQNIDSLSQLGNLTKISFPHLLQTYCYEAKSVLKSMKENIDGPTSNNLNLMHCRGKKNYKVISAQRKVRNGTLLTSEESEALDDYEANLSWSGEAR